MALIAYDMLLGFLFSHTFAEKFISSCCDKIITLHSVFYCLYSQGYHTTISAVLPGLFLGTETGLWPCQN